jgi:hypothetical protein
MDAGIYCIIQALRKPGLDACFEACTRIETASLLRLLRLLLVETAFSLQGTLKPETEWIRRSAAGT